MKYTITLCLFEIAHSDMNYILFLKFTYQYFIKKNSEYQNFQSKQLILL